MLICDLVNRPLPCTCEPLETAIEFIIEIFLWLVGVIACRQFFSYNHKSKYTIRYYEI